MPRQVQCGDCGMITSSPCAHPDCGLRPPTPKTGPLGTDVGYAQSISAAVSNLNEIIQEATMTGLRAEAELTWHQSTEAHPSPFISVRIFREL